VNDLDKILLLGECKLSEKKISINRLKQKSETIIRNYDGYKIYYREFYPGMLEKFLENPIGYLLKKS
jgi:hypothetical protein